MYKKYFTLIFFLFTSVKLYAWFSWWADATHRRMTTDIMPIISPSEYPDIIRFQNRLINTKTKSINTKKSAGYQQITIDKINYVNIIIGYGKTNTNRI